MQGNNWKGNNGLEQIKEVTEGLISSFLEWTVQKVRAETKVRGEEQEDTGSWLT